MKTSKIGLTALITLLSIFSAPFTAIFLAPPVLSQSPPSAEDGYNVCRVRSQAMRPAMDYYNQVLINQLAYRSALPKRGDIIVFRPNKAMLQQYILTEAAFPISLDGIYLIRRIIGLPGETVRVEGGRVYVNDQPLEERYINNRPNYILTQVTVPANSYFVLGDSRNNSSDSHTWGFVTRDLIVGQFVRLVEKNAQLKQTELTEQAQLKSKLAQTSTTVCQLY